MKQIPIGKTVYKVSDFLSFQRSGTLELSPSFQRRPVWKPAAKSFLMDTIVRGLPVPIIFIRERTNLRTLEPEREVVDGQQRLRTIISFIEPLALKDYNPANDSFLISPIHNPEIANTSFSQLPVAVRKRILNYEFSVHTLPADTDDREVLQIFARLNSTGVSLRPQELRNAEYYGPFKTLMYSLAYEQLGRWRTWKIFSEYEIARMDEVELTSDLTLFMFKGITGKSQKAIDKLYKDHEEQFSEGEEVARRFRSVMEEIDKLVGSDMPSLAYSRSALFHTLFSFTYDLMYGVKSSLKKRQPRPLPNRLGERLVRASNIIQQEELPEDLAKALRGATSHPGTRKTRIDFLREVCLRASAKS